jgi:hypothetical protein
MEIRWARAATRHRISHARSKHAVLNAIVTTREPAPTNSAQPDDRIVFLGFDQNGTMLEVLAIETETGLLIIHAMPIRRKYLHYLKRANDD